jgi:hypothetical protein
MGEYFLSIKGVWLLLAAMAALLVGGCGGSDNSEAGASGGEITVETGSLSKAQFIKRADEMCRKDRAQAVREFQAFMSETGQSTQLSPQEEKARLGEVVDTILVPIYEKLIDQLAALGAPEGGEQEVAGFLGAVRRVLDRLEGDPTLLNSLNNPFTPASERARKYGLTGCAGSLD